MKKIINFIILTISNYIIIVETPQPPELTKITLLGIQSPKGILVVSHTIGKAKQLMYRIIRS